MQCPRCQHDTPASSRFCTECGARLTLSCGGCGAELAEGVRFCGQCGRPVDGKPTGPARFASPETYTPRHLAERILTSKSAIEGERKQVTVLFADLQGSLELLADRDPEEARKILDPVLEYMMEAVHQYEGTVNQVMGDGIMALFGAPLAHEDHAVRACYAALRMQESVKRHAREVRRTEGIPIQIRVGLNSGEVVVRSIGNDLRMSYTAVGQTTHLAARMEQMATPGAVLTTAETLRLAEGYVETRSLGTLPVKGLDIPLEVFEVTGAGMVRSRLQASARRGLSRFVGRALELDQLHEALEQAEAGRGQVVAVVGEPGVGKSRLVHEITQAVSRPQWLVLEGRSLSYGKATPYLPITDLLRGYFQIEARDGAREIHTKVLARLRALDPALEPTLPAFLALLDAPADDARWQALDPALRRQRTLDAIMALLLRESRSQPLLLVLEDLQWVDSETQTLLDGLVERVPRARIVLLANFRPEYQDGWGGKTYYTRLRLNTLAHESADELLQALLGVEPGLASLKRLLIERTDGNPFFLEESVRTLVETGALEGLRGQYRAARPLAGTQIPATVQSILAARIDRLPDREKRLLQSASVIGKDVPFAVLQALEDAPEEELRRALGHLQAAEFLYETSLFPDLEYTFKHALTHEVAYGALLYGNRRALHARLVSVIERLATGRLAEQVDRLAHHALQGGLWDQAVRLFRKAGAKAAAHSAYREAVTCSEQALDALAHLPPGKERDELEVDLRLDLHNALTPHGEVVRMLETLHEAERVAGALGDQRRLGRIAAYMTQGYWWSGQPDRAVESAERALAIAGTLGDRALATIATLRLGQAYLSLGEYRQAIAAFARNVADFESKPSGGESKPTGGAALRSATAHAFMAWALAYLGEFAEASTHGAEAERLAEAAQHELSLAVAYAGAGRPHLVQGNFPLAVSWLGRSVEICRRASFGPLFLLVASDLGQAYALSGRAEEGVALLAEAVTQSAALNLRPTHAWNLTMLGEACALAGRPEEALAHVERGLGMARAQHQRWLVAEALRVLGQLRSAEGAAGPARAALEEAAGIARDIGLRPLLGRCHHALGEALHRAGEPAAARGHLEQAAALFREMDMRFWLGRAEAAARLLELPPSGNSG
jgi:class 3 adenylate cyclase/tetratricopeptide (TPR) repeat protein